MLDLTKVRTYYIVRIGYKTIQRFWNDKYLKFYTKMS